MYKSEKFFIEVTIFNQSKGSFLRNDDSRDEDGRRSDSPKSIESGSADSGLNEENPTKSWETTEQRMNTDPPVGESRVFVLVCTLAFSSSNVQFRHCR